MKFLKSLIFALLTFLPSVFAQTQDFQEIAREIGSAMGFIVAIITLPYFVIILILVLFIILFYGLISAALSKVPIFNNDEKQRRTVSLVLAILMTLGLLGAGGMQDGGWSPDNFQENIARMMSPFGTISPLVLGFLLGVIVFFSTGGGEQEVGTRKRLGWGLISFGVGVFVAASSNVRYSQGSSLPLAFGLFFGFIGLLLLVIKPGSGVDVGGFLSNVFSGGNQKTKEEKQMQKETKKASKDSKKYQKFLNKSTDKVNVQNLINDANVRLKDEKDRFAEEENEFHHIKSIFQEIANLMRNMSDEKASHEIKKKVNEMRKSINSGTRLERRNKRQNRRIFRDYDKVQRSFDSLKDKYEKIKTLVDSDSVSIIEQEIKLINYIENILKGIKGHVRDIVIEEGKLMELDKDMLSKLSDVDKELDAIIKSNSIQNATERMNKKNASEQKIQAIFRDEFNETQQAEEVMKLIVSHINKVEQFAIALINLNKQSIYNSENIDGKINSISKKADQRVEKYDGFNEVLSKWHKVCSKLEDSYNEFVVQLFTDNATEIKVKLDNLQNDLTEAKTTEKVMYEHLNNPEFVNDEVSGEEIKNEIIPSFQRDEGFVKSVQEDVKLILDNNLASSIINNAYIDGINRVIDSNTISDKYGEAQKIYSSLSQLLSSSNLSRSFWNLAEPELNKIAKKIESVKAQNNEPLTNA